MDTQTTVEPTSVHVTDALALPAFQSRLLRDAAYNAVSMGQAVELFTAPALHPKTKLPTKTLVETLVIDDENALQSVGGKPPTGGEWRASERLVVVYADGDTIRLQLNGEKA